MLYNFNYDCVVGIKSYLMHLEDFSIQAREFYSYPLLKYLVKNNKISKLYLIET